MTFTATLIDVDRETRRAHVERDGRLFTIPLTPEETRALATSAGKQLVLTFITSDVGEPAVAEV